MSDMMIFAGCTHLVVAALCSDFDGPLPPRWIWWLFASVLLVDGLDAELSDVGKLVDSYNRLTTHLEVDLDEWMASVQSRMAALAQIPAFTFQVELHMVGRAVVVLLLLQNYAPAMVHWLKTGFPRDFPTLSHLGRNLMTIYACIADRPVMQLMAGLSLLFIGLCAKDLGPIEHGKQGEKAGYLFLATILILDGLLAPSEVAVSDGAAE